MASFAEAISLGAIIPFLTAVSSPEILAENKISAAVISQLGLSNHKEMIIAFSIIFGIAVVFSSSMRLFALLVQTRITALASSDLVEIAYSNIMRQGYLYHLRNNASQMTSTLIYDLNVASSVIQQFFFISAQIVLIIVIVTSLFLIEPIIVIGMSTLVLLNYLTVASRTKEILRRRFIEISNKNREFFKQLNLGFSAIREIILANQQHKTIKDLIEIDRPMRLLQAGIPFIQTIPRFTMEITGIITLVVVLTLLAINFGTFIEALPVIGAMAYATNRLMPAAHNLYTSISSMRAAYVSVNRTIEVMTTPPEDLPNSKSNQLINIKKEIQLSDLSFSYNTEAVHNGQAKEATIDGLHATIKANEVTAIVGTSGSGKTTLANVIMGLFPIERGEIKIDGIALTNDDMIAWRRSVSHVPQDVFLFDGTIKENIVFGSDDSVVDSDHLNDTVRTSQLDQLLAKSSDGLERRVGDRGAFLSGGQRQRIAIARALYNQASLIVLDEATSALDNPTQDAIITAIKKLATGVTVIVIAHRTQMIKKADNILVLRDGAIVANGTYDYLMKTSEYFGHLIAEEANTTPNQKSP